MKLMNKHSQQAYTGIRFPNRYVASFPPFAGSDSPCVSRYGGQYCIRSFCRQLCRRGCHERHCALWSHQITDGRIERPALRRLYNSLRQIPGSKPTGEDTEFVFTGYLSGNCGRDSLLPFYACDSVSSDLSGFLTHDDSVRLVFNQYLLGQAVGVLPFFLGRQLSVFLTMRNQINLTTIASLIMIAVNALLNLLFVADSALGRVRCRAGLFIGELGLFCCAGAVLSAWERRSPFCSPSGFVAGADRS